MTIIELNNLTKNLHTLSLSKTSAGVLCKWETKINGELLYCKSGTCSAGLFNSRQPQAEVMASRIAKQLNLDGYIDTLYFTTHFNETDEYTEQDALISCTKNFLEKNQAYWGVHNFLIQNELKSNDLYKVIIDKFSQYKKLINEMIIFDFIILNIDRHLNNFGFIVNENNEIVKMAPLFDNGLSLLANFSDSELKELSDLFIDKKMKVKPFSGDPYKQIKKISKDDLKKILPNGLNELEWNEIFRDLNISEFRKIKIRRFVKGEWLMSKIYYLKVKDELVGTIAYPELKFIRDKNYKKSLPLGLAPWQSEYTYEPTKEEILKFLKSRVVQENNQGILIIMKELGYGAYNLEALLDETCGMNFNDFVWLLPEEKKHWDFETYHMRVHPELYIQCIDV